MCKKCHKMQTSSGGLGRGRGRLTQSDSNDGYTFAGLATDDGAPKLDRLKQFIVKYAEQAEPLEPEHAVAILASLNDVMTNDKLAAAFGPLDPRVFALIIKCLEMFAKNPSVMELITRILSGISATDNSDMDEPVMEVTPKIVISAVQQKQWKVVEQSLIVIHNLLCKRGTQQKLIANHIHVLITNLLSECPMPSGAPIITRCLDALGIFICAVSDDPSLTCELSKFMCDSFVGALNVYSKITSDMPFADDCSTSCLSYMTQLLHHKPVQEYALSQNIVAVLMSKATSMSTAIELERLLELLDVIANIPGPSNLFDTAFIQQLKSHLLPKAFTLRIPFIFTFLKTMNATHLDALVESSILETVTSTIQDMPFNMQEAAVLYICDSIDRLPVHLTPKVITPDTAFTLTTHLQCSSLDTINLIGSALMKLHDADPDTWSHTMSTLDLELESIHLTCPDPAAARQLEALHAFLFPTKS